MCAVQPELGGWAELQVVSIRPEVAPSHGNARSESRTRWLRAFPQPKPRRRQPLRSGVDACRSKEMACSLLHPPGLHSCCVLPSSLPKNILPPPPPPFPNKRPFVVQARALRALRGVPRLNTVLSFSALLVSSLLV